MNDRHGTEHAVLAILDLDVSSIASSDSGSLWVPDLSGIFGSSLWPLMNPPG